MVMVTEPQSKPLVPILLAATLLLWPAFWNGYPLVFSDTGTYLSQAINHYIGWDRPTNATAWQFGMVAASNHHHTGDNDIAALVRRSAHARRVHRTARARDDAADFRA
jgi:hypothetical protein